jgi:hypothetical protein
VGKERQGRVVTGDKGENALRDNIGGTLGGNLGESVWGNVKGRFENNGGNAENPPTDTTLQIDLGPYINAHIEGHIRGFSEEEDIHQLQAESGHLSVSPDIMDQLDFTCPICGRTFPG